MWEDASNQRLKFVDLSSKHATVNEDKQLQANIDVSFARRNHNCIEELDGPGGIVAHSAYLPHGLIHLSRSMLVSYFPI